MRQFLYAVQFLGFSSHNIAAESFDFDMNLPSVVQHVCAVKGCFFFCMHKGELISHLLKSQDLLKAIIFVSSGFFFGGQR